MCLCILDLTCLAYDVLPYMCVHVAVQAGPRGQVKREHLTDTQIQWLLQTVNANTYPDTGNVIMGSWPRIHAEFCERFGVERSLLNLQVTYSRLMGRDFRAQERAANAKERVGLPIHA